MIVDEFFRSEAAQNSLRTAINTLNSFNGLGLFKEIAHQRTLPPGSPKPLESSALQGAWHNGYIEALNDIFYFFDRYNTTPKIKPGMDFGAVFDLLKEGEITEDEYTTITGRVAPKLNK